MTGLHELFDDMAQEAKLYEVTDRALGVMVRRRRVKRAAVPLLAVLAVLVVLGVFYTPPAGLPAPAATPPPSGGPRQFPASCAAQRLTLPAGFPFAYVTGGDASAKMLVGELLPGQQQGDGVPVMWRDGRPELLDPPGDYAYVADVNSLGTVVGNGEEQAWVYHDGTYTMLKGTGSGASAISETGVIAGQINGRPVVWRDPGADPEYLTLLEGGAGGAVDIDADGTVIGNVTGPDGKLIPHVWRPDKTVVTLPQAQVVSSISLSQVSGQLQDGGAAVWDARTGELLRRVGLHGQGTTVNPSGWIAGQAKDSTTLKFVGPTGEITLTPPADLPNVEGGTVRVLSFDGMTLAGHFYDRVGHDTDLTPVIWRCAL